MEEHILLKMLDVAEQLVELERQKLLLEQEIVTRQKAVIRKEAYRALVSLGENE